MKTLEDAWHWYLAVKNGMRQLDHLAKFWEDLPWGQEDPWISRLERDSVLRELQSDQMAEGSAAVLQELDDLAILVLFSVFEAIVRHQLDRELNHELKYLTHPMLVKAGQDVLDAVAQGSFFRLLEPFKPTDADLVEQVNQVRRYRNWVAHGRREDMKPQDLVQPLQVYERLTRFLTVLSLSSNRTVSIPTENIE